MQILTFRQLANYVATPRRRGRGISADVSTALFMLYGSMDRAVDFHDSENAFHYYHRITLWLRTHAPSLILHKRDAFLKLKRRNSIKASYGIKFVDYSW